MTRLLPRLMTLGLLSISAFASPQVFAQDCATKPLSVSSEAASYGKLAKDFSVATQSGRFQLSDQWNGCDSFVVFKNFTVAAGHPLKNLSDLVKLMWSSRFEYLLQFSPRNTHYIFVSQNFSAEQRDRDVREIEANLNLALQPLPIAEQAYWRSRIHFVTEDTTSLGSAWIGTVGVESFVIDPDQKVRPIGIGAYSPLLQNGDFLKLAMEAQYSQFITQRARELAAQTHVKIVPAFQNEVVEAGWSSFGGTIKEVEFPSAEELKAYDKLSLDLELSCGGQNICVYPSNQYYYDRVIDAFLCRDEADQECDIEIGRWVTPFGLGGRWVHDISGLRALVKDGGKKRIRFHTVDKYNVTLNFRFAKSGAPSEIASAPKPFAIQEVYRGGKLNAAFNQRAPYEFTVPEGTRKVELVTTTTGHGWGKDTANCAEFCVTDHEWTVNSSQKWVNSFQTAADQFYCFLSSAAGVVPNQPGTWYFGRGGWCPGQEVRPVVWDITAAVKNGVGEVNALQYRALFNGQDYVPVPNPAGAANGYDAEINLRSYIVFSR